MAVSTILDDLRTIIAQNVVSKQDLDFLTEKVEEHTQDFHFI